MSGLRDFVVKSCTLPTIATGLSASSLLELREKLAIVDEGCIYHHFWGGRMNPQFVNPQNHNDFANWVFQRLHDHTLAERLSIIDPIEFDSLESLRQEVLETIEKRLDEIETIVWTKREDRFFFIKASIIVFETGVKILEPDKNLSKTISALPPSSIFFHLIDARARNPDKVDDFSAWLKKFGNQYDSLIETIQSIDPYFLTLTQLRDELSSVIKSYFERGSKNG